MDDQSLLQQYVQSGSRPALDQRVRRHLDMVYASARRELHDEHLAADVTQAVFLILARRASRIGPRVVLGGWLFKVMRYASADARKSQARRAHHERKAAAMKPEATQPGESEIDPRIIPLLNDAIASLPGSYRDAVVMKYLEGKSHLEVAEAQQITENAARQRLFRAIEKLRGKLASKYFGDGGARITTAVVAATLSSASAESAPAVVVSALQSALFTAQAQTPAAVFATNTLRNMYMLKAKLIAVLGAIAVITIAGGLVRLAMAQQAVQAPATSPTSQPTATATTQPMPKNQPVESPLAGTRWDTRLMQSAEKEHQIFAAIQTYASEHHNQFPPGLGTLISKGLINATDLDVFLQPDSTAKVPAQITAGTKKQQAAWVNENSEYVLLTPGQAPADLPPGITADKVPALSPKDANHSTVRVPIAMYNGLILFCKPAQVKQILHPDNP